MIVKTTAIKGEGLEALTAAILAPRTPTLAPPLDEPTLAAVMRTKAER